MFCAQSSVLCPEQCSLPRAKLTWHLSSSEGGQVPAPFPGWPVPVLPALPCSGAASPGLPACTLLQWRSHSCFQIQKADPGVRSAPEGRGEDPAERQAVPGAGLRARGAAQADRVLRG